MANKIETSHSGMFLDTKLRTILNDLNKELIDSRLSTKEDVSSLFNKIIKDYYKNLSKSIFTYRSVASGTDPDITRLNTDNFLIYNDLKILYTSLKNTRDLLGSNYNALSGMILKVKTDIAEASSKLIDYKIQNTNKFAPMFLDSFFNLSKIENDDSKYTKSKAFVDTFNNNLVLPLDKEAAVAKVKRINIAEDSIGISGNNQEVGSIARDNLKLAFDNAIDTWFEFEQVGVQELEAPTILNLKLEFEEEIFFNLLDINVAQMPNGSYPAIFDIKGSQDGSNFFSLKSLFLGTLVKDSLGNEVIQLGEITENPNGGNLLYFSPRKIKHLSIKLTEDSSYFIRSSSGIKYRRAIGIRELKAKSQKFKNEGQLITTNFLSNKELSKIALFTNEYMPSNFKSTFNYFISVDNGLNWEEISPSQKIKEKIPEILNYNIDFVESSKKTDFPITGVKLKAEFSIEEGEENTSITSSYITKKQTEFRNLAPGIKDLTLDRVPFGSVQLYQTNYGSVGKDTYYRMPNSLMKELQDRFVIQLPLDIYPSQSIQINQEQFFIDNYIWNRVDEFTSDHNTNSLVYTFDYTNNIATFYKASNLDRLGKKPSNDIFFKLKRENVALKPAESGTVIQTNFSHDSIKENISIYSISEENSQVGYKLKNLASVHRPMVEEIESISVDTDIDNVLNEEKTFINGVIELSDIGDYSIDKKRGVFYTHTSLTNTQEVLITLNYKKKVPVTFEIINGEIVTTESLKKDNKVFSIDIVTPSYAIDLGFKNIEEKSIIFTELPDEMIQEISFKNLEIEFNQPNTSGKYCIDYKNGVLYLQKKITGKLSGTLVNSNYFAEYNITHKIDETNYTIFTAERRIELSDKFVSDLYNSFNNEFLSPSLLKVQYIYTEDVKESLSELLPYTTPFIREYKILTTPKEIL